VRHFQGALDQLHAVLVAEAEIGQEKVDLFALEHAHCPRYVARDVNVVIVLEQTAQAVARMFFVVND